MVKSNELLESLNKAMKPAVTEVVSESSENKETEEKKCGGKKKGKGK
jgi:hypothetical protein